MYYLRARYYDPNIGRFTTEDSYWGEDVNSLSLNLYTYCENDPIRFVDPTGHKQQIVVYNLDGEISHVDPDKLDDAVNKGWIADKLEAFKKGDNELPPAISYTLNELRKEEEKTKDATERIKLAIKATVIRINYIYNDNKAATVEEYFESLGIDTSKENMKKLFEVTKKADPKTTQKNWLSSLINSREELAEKLEIKGYEDNDKMNTKIAEKLWGSTYIKWSSKLKVQADNYLFYSAIQEYFDQVGIKVGNTAGSISEFMEKFGNAIAGNEKDRNYINNSIGDFFKNLFQGTVNKIIDITGNLASGNIDNNEISKWFKQFSKASKSEKTDMLSSLTNDILWQIPIAAVTDGLMRVKLPIKVVPKTKAQVVINNEVWTQFDIYVQGTKLKGINQQGLLETQETFAVKNLGQKSVKPDYSIYNTNGQLTAIGDAKSGAIVFDDQAKGFVQVAAQQTTSKTVIYYTPLGNTTIPADLVNYARLNGVTIK